MRRMVVEEFTVNCIEPIVKYGGGGIMVWGCINSTGAGCVSKVEGKFNGEEYIDILENALIPTTHALAMPREWIFQQDNATWHTSKLVREWFTEEKIAVMELPAQSPNLNPIENLWDEIKAKAQEQNPRSVNELWPAVKNAWDAFPVARVTNLIESMPRRCGTVIKAKGGTTKY